MVTPTKISICVILYVAGFFTAKALTPPPVAEVKAAVVATVVGETQAATSAKKTTKEKFNCPNGNLSERETSEDVTQVLTQKYEAKLKAALEAKLAPVELPDDAELYTTSQLHVGLKLTPAAALPILPKTLRVGYEYDLQRFEHVGVLGWSFKLFN